MIDNGSNWRTLVNQLCGCAGRSDEGTTITTSAQTTSDFEVVPQVPQGARHVVILPIDAKTKFGRFGAWLWVAGVRRRAVERALRKATLSVEGCFAVYPSVDNPSIVYELESYASIYAARFLLPSVSGRVANFVLGWLTRPVGCPSSIGAIVIVAKRR